MEHAGDNYTNCNWSSLNCNKRIIKETGERVETIETTTLLRTTIILKRALDT